MVGIQSVGALCVPKTAVTSITPSYVPIAVRGNEISSDTVQINTKVLKEGKKKFESLFEDSKEEKSE
ncbi:MAG: hypothetical protein IH845_03775 [Nanoarchaeota archaeon]|nr:hypothetical protein [Nanoarchaeota archaeon]